jgi:hypothetical protein
MLNVIVVKTEVRKMNGVNAERSGCVSASRRTLGGELLPDVVFGIVGVTSAYKESINEKPDVRLFVECIEDAKTILKVEKLADGFLLDIAVALFRNRTTPVA